MKRIYLIALFSFLNIAQADNHMVEKDGHREHHGGKDKHHRLGKNGDGTWKTKCQGK